MSILVSLSDGDAHAVPLGAAATVGALLDAIHAALALPHPAGAYELWVGGDGAGGGVEVGGRGDAALGEVGIVGCEERVGLRVKHKWVVRGVLAGEGIETEAEAAAALREAIYAGDMARVQRLAASGLTEVVSYVIFALRARFMGAAEAIVAAAGDDLPTERLGMLLHETCRVNALRVAGQLLAVGADARALLPDGRTPLHTLCQTRGGGADVADLLLTAGGDANARLVTGETPLHIACAHGNAAVARMLLHCGADARAAAREGKTALHVACHWIGGHLELLEALLAAGADVNATWRGHTPLVVLCSAARADGAAIALFAAHGADLNARGDGGRAPLHLSASRGALTSVRALLAGGAAVNATTEGQKTALHLAVEAQHRATVGLLLDHGADVHAMDATGATALHAACAGCAADVVQRLLDAGADSRVRAASGVTPLHVACSCEGAGADVVALLLQHGARVADGGAPLHAACARGRVEVVRRLLTACTADDVNRIAGAEGATPLHVVCADGGAGAGELVVMLVAGGAAVDARDSAGQTALHIAGGAANSALVATLLARGADVSAADTRGRTPGCASHPSVSGLLHSADDTRPSPPRITREAPAA